MSRSVPCLFLGREQQMLLNDFLSKLFPEYLSLFLAVALSLTGCVESRFSLSPESRLPKWFEVPEGMSRENINVTVDYYIHSGGGEAVFKLYGNNGNRLEKVKAEMGIYPLHLANPPEGSSEGYPVYEIVTVDGVTDIIEHRGMNDIFYMTDDPAVWKELGLVQE